MYCVVRSQQLGLRELHSTVDEFLGDFNEVEIAHERCRLCLGNLKLMGREPAVTYGCGQCGSRLDYNQAHRGERVGRPPNQFGSVRPSPMDPKGDALVV